jgi:hypothetical protein
MIALALAVVLACPCPPAVHHKPVVHHVVPKPAPLAVPCYQPPPVIHVATPVVPPAQVVIQRAEPSWINRHWWIVPVAGIVTYAIVEHNEGHGGTSVYLSTVGHSGGDCDEHHKPHRGH